MGLEGPVKLGYRNELAAIADPAERKARFDEMVADAYERGKAIHQGVVFGVDDVIDPVDTRALARQRAALGRRPGAAGRAAPRRRLVRTVIVAALEVDDGAAGDPDEVVRRDRRRRRSTCRPRPTPRRARAGRVDEQGQRGGVAEGRNAADGVAGGVAHDVGIDPRALRPPAAAASLRSSSWLAPLT